MLFELRSVLQAMLCICLHSSVLGEKYYGKFISNLSSDNHGLKGKVYAVNFKTLFIENFEYDGEAPDTFFWGDVKKKATSSGFIIPNENGKTDSLQRYDGQDLILMLPDGKTLFDTKSFSIWSRHLSLSLGSIEISPNDIPIERQLGPIPTLAHAVRSKNVVIKDEKTLYISELHYDGAGPDAFFLVGKGPRPRSNNAIKVPDENNRLTKLKGYQGKNIVLHLPGNLTIFDIEWFGLYCIAFEQNFGHVVIPVKPNIPANMDNLRLAVEASTQRRSVRSEKMPRGQYLGQYIGDFKTNVHDVKGSVYAASDDTFYIANFTYDGQGPDAFFWVGVSDVPSPEGFIVPDEFATKQVLRKYSGENIAITLPDGKKISDVKWLSVWCRKFAVNFGYITIPDGFQLPKEQSLGPLPSLAHSVRATQVIIKDAKTIHITGLHYDGSAPDAFFYVGTGTYPHKTGIKIPDENGSLNKLRGYQGKDVTIRLPDNVTIFDVDWFSLFCISFEQNFGHVLIPDDLNIPADIKSLRSLEMKFDNCEEIFPGVMQVSWRVLGQDLYVQLKGTVGDNEYLSFGRSGQDDFAAMVGADVVVAFFDSESNEAKVVDYYLSSKSQCSQGSGACPDHRLRGSQHVELVSYERVNGHLSVTYKRPLAAGDGQDLSIPLSIPVSIVAAIGPLNSHKEASFHPQYYSKEMIKIHFGRNAQDRCHSLHASMAPKVASWPPHRISGVRVFKAQIGPTGGSKGYTAITGIQSWGNAWWINDLLIPELYVQRGVNYTFVVEGGDDPSNSAQFHPLYITNNPEGGGGQFLDQLGTENHKIFGGVMTDGQRLIPIGVGRQCKWKHRTVDQSEVSESFEQFKATLYKECEEGNPGQFVWTPDEDTPDIVYYQCFTHRNLGWKIHVQGSVGDGFTMSHFSESSSSNVVSLNMIFILLLAKIVSHINSDSHLR